MRFELRDDNIKVDWDEKQMKCEPEIYFERFDPIKGHNITYSLEVRLQDVMRSARIEDMIEERDKIRKEHSQDSFETILGYMGRWDYVQVVKFLKACLDNKIDVREEIKFLNSKKKIIEWIEVVKDRIEGKKESLKQYKKGSDSYKSNLEQTKKEKAQLDFLLEIKN